MRRPIKTYLPRLITLLALGALLAAGVYTGVAPAPQQPELTTDFSIQHALAHVRSIATRPHPAGSPANDGVRAYLLDQLTRLRLDPHVQTATVHSLRDNADVTLRNVVARLAGKSTTRPTTQTTQPAAAPPTAILLACHYDSVPYGPGAGDDIAAVAALLETARALRAGPPPAHDVLFLFTDGEEKGMLGARAFFDASGANSQIALAFNFDARGTAGASLMYETAPHNLALVRHFAAADPQPTASSLAYDVYQMLPNNSDFTVFRRAGSQGLNFAFIDSYFNYHTKNDTPENLDPASLYHQGRHALSLAKHFANLSAEELAAVRSTQQPDAVYFNLTRGLLVVYPTTWIWPLTTLQLFLTVAAVYVTWRNRRPTWRGVGLSILSLVLSFGVVPFAVLGLSLLLGEPSSAGRFHGVVAALIALAAILTCCAAYLPKLVGGCRAGSSPIIVLALLTALCVAAAVYVPGGTALVLWPAVFLALAMLAAEFLPPNRWTRAGLAVVAMAPTLLLHTGLAVQLFTALTLNRAALCSVGVVLSTWMVLSAWRLVDVAAESGA